MPKDVTPVKTRPTKDRIDALDVLRGVAVFGILVVNVEQMFLPLFYANDPVAAVPGAWGTKLAWFVTDAFFESKFLTVFCLLFGAGFALQLRRSHEAGFRRRFLRRVAMLGGFGLLHAAFFYSADVLLIYALTALVLLAFRRATVPRMVKVAVALLVVTVAWGTLIMGPDSADTPGRQLAAVEAVAAVRASGQIELADGGEPGGEDGSPIPTARTHRVPLPPDLARLLLTSDSEQQQAVAQYTVFSDGPVGEAVGERLRHLRFLILLLLPLYAGWRTLGLFLLGAAVAVSGRLGPGNGTFWRRTVTVGIALGLPMTLTASTMTVLLYQDQGQWVRLAHLLHELSSYLLAAALAGSVWFWARRGLRTPALRGLAAVGRTALTNYVGQSVVMSLVATSYGLGLFGDLTRLQLLGLAITCFAMQMLVSSWWLRRYRSGPLEWLWRCFTYWRRLPLRRSPLGPLAETEAAVEP